MNKLMQNCFTGGQTCLL